MGGDNAEFSTERCSSYIRLLGGELLPFARGEESVLVRGVRLVDFWGPSRCAMLASLLAALKIEDVVLVELVEPTSCAMSLIAVSFSSCISEFVTVVRGPFGVPLARVSPSPSPSKGAGGTESALEEQGRPVDGDRCLLRSCEALERFCWSTEGAVGKKSAKPFDERDILGDGHYLYRLRCTISPIQLARSNDCDS